MSILTIGLLSRFNGRKGANKVPGKEQVGNVHLEGLGEMEERLLT